MFRYWNYLFGLTICLVGWLGMAGEAEASHFRGGTLSYRIICTNNATCTGGKTCTVKTGTCAGGVPAIGRTVEATLDTYWRIGTSGSGNPSRISYSGTRSGSLSRYSATRAKRVGSADNIVVKYRGTLPSNGTYTLRWTGCCWIGGVSGPKGSRWDLAVTIPIGTKVNNDPQLNSPTFFNWCEGIPFQTNLNASDPDGDPITYSLIDFARSPTRVPSATSPDRLQIDQKGEISWSKPKAGRWVVSVVIKDNKNGTTYRDFMLDVAKVCSNKQPSITLTPPSARTKVGQKVCVVVKGTDANAGQKLTFFVNPKKVGATPANPPANQTAPSTWTWCWTPIASDNLKIHDILFTVLDNGSPQLTRQATLKVSVGIEVPPSITIDPVGTIKKLDEGKTLTFKGTALDPDGNGIKSFTFKGPAFCKAGKTGATIITVVCKPGANDGGKTHNMTFTAVDKDGKPKTTTLLVRLIVRDNLKNRPPTIKAPGDQVAKEKSPYSLQINATDPDGDKLTYTMKGLPSGAKIDPKTGKITWTPTQKDVGVHNVEVTVSDGFGGKTVVKFKVTVSNVNDPPVFTGPEPGKTATEDKPYAYSPKATDPDPGDQGKLTWKLTKKPAGAKIDPKTGKITWTPGDASAGKDVDFEVEVCDPAGACTKKAWKVKTKNVNDPPKITSTPPTVAYAKEELKYKPVVVDPDPKSTQTWTKVKGPAGSKIDPKTGELTWTPGTGDVGKEFDFEIKVCDDQNACVTQKFKVKVKQPCTIDTDCPSPSICYQADGRWRCEKPGCANQTPKCATKGDYCKTGKCGKNPCTGKQCKTGEYCNPNSGQCIKACQGVTCQTGEYCLDGVCKKDPCAAAPCKSDEYCDTSTKTPTCKKQPCTGQSCRHGRVCQPRAAHCIDDPCSSITCPDPKNQRCVAGQCILQKKCKIDTDCPGEEICLAGLCKPQSCYGTKKCTTSEVCMDGKCTKNDCPPNGSVTCPKGETCRPGTNKCFKSCAEVKCATGEKCVDGVCGKDPCAGKKCNAGETCVAGKCEPNNCSASNVCKFGRVCDPARNACVEDPCKGVKCPDKQVCVPTTGQCSLPPKCTWDSDCPGAVLCVKGACLIPGCANNSECKQDEVCGDGKCLPSSCAGKQCKDGKFCKNGACVGSCAGVFCGKDEVCTNGSCGTDPCAGKSCGNDEVCENGKCVKTCGSSGASCKNGRLCSSTGCTDDACFSIKCPTGQTCKGGQCSGDLTCSLDADCPGDSVCEEGKCQPKGCYKDGCSNKELCIKGKCVANPCAAQSCNDGEVCQPASGKCVPKCPTCKDTEKCEDGKCVPDSCAGKKCPPNERCENGTCKKNGCEAKATPCKFQRVCSNDKCGDDPCLSVKCGANEACKDGVCVKPPPGPEPKPEPGPEPKAETAPEPKAEAVPEAGPVVETGANPENFTLRGGCQCHAFGSDGPFNGFVALLMLLFAGGLLRRRFRQEADEN